MNTLCDVSLDYPIHKLLKNQKCAKHLVDIGELGKYREKPEGKMGGLNNTERIYTTSS